jgi:hypothetical protein
VGLARTVPQLMVSRFVQAFGASGGLSIGAAVIGDIYKLEERGAAMGVFFAVCIISISTQNFTFINASRRAYLDQPLHRSQEVCPTIQPLSRIYIYNLKTQL